MSYDIDDRAYFEREYKGLFSSPECMALHHVWKRNPKVAERTWQPIETAPKDGTKVLLGWFELPGMSMMRVGGWHSGQRGWCDSHRLLHNSASPPTHWQPLPAPPVREGEEEK